MIGRTTKKEGEPSFFVISERDQAGRMLRKRVESHFYAHRRRRVYSVKARIGKGIFCFVPLIRILCPVHQR